MPRVLVSPSVSIPEPQPDDENGESLDSVLSSSKPKRKRTKATPSQIERSFREFDELFKSKRWESEPKAIRSDHAVAFYARLHEKIYGVYPEELRDGQAWLGACSGAKCFLEKEFVNGTELFRFILWTWQKERDRVKWLRDNDKPMGRRITWRDQFVLRYKLTDYRQSIAEAKERGKRR